MNRIIISFRGVISTSIILLGIGIFVIVNNSKEKSEYKKSTGTIEYFDKVFQNLPTRNLGDYRYLKVNTYPYLFEIYMPNNKVNDVSLDNLEVGDIIDIYYYETSDTKNAGINRFTQFIDVEGLAYYIRNGFQSQLGYVLIVLSSAMILMAFILWKKGKLHW